MTHNTTAIVLKRETFREADLSVSLLTREYGKVRAVAIGAKKITSKLAGQLEPTRELRLMLAPGRSFDKIGQAVLSDNFGLKSGLEELYLAQKATGLVEKLAPENQKETEVYELLKDFLSARQNFLFFNIKLLALTGHQPELYKCTVCREPVESKNNFFNFDRGGLVCAACAGETKNEKQEEISQEVLEVWRDSSSGPTEEINKKLLNLIEEFIQYRIF